MRSLDTEVPTSLIVLVEPLTENAVGHVDEIAQTLFNDLQSALIEGARTKTFSIELAIQNASRRLNTHAETQEFENRQIVSIACVEIQEDQAIIGLSGPTHCFLRDQAGLFSLTTEDHESAAPVGVSGQLPKVRFFNTNLQHQELLLTTSATRSDQILSNIMSSDLVRTNLWNKVIEHLRDTPSASAVLIAWEEDIGDEARDKEDIHTQNTPSTHSRSRSAAFKSAPIKIKHLVSKYLWQVLSVLLVLSISVTIGLQMYEANQFDFWNEHEQIILEAKLQASQSLLVARGNSTSAESWATLHSAQQMLTDTLNITGTNSELEALQAEIQLRITTLDKTTLLTDLKLVLAPSPLDTNVHYGSFVLANNHLWILESNSGKVLKIDDEGSSQYVHEVIFVRGVTYQGVPSNTPVDIAWDEPRNRLLILDINGKLFASDPTSKYQPKPIAGSLSLSEDTKRQFVTTGDTIYMLSSDGVVTTYVISRSAIRKIKTSQIDQVSESNLFKLDAYKDGMIVLGDEGLYGIRQGTPISIVPNVSPSPEKPTSILSTNGGLTLLIGDPANQRIIHISDTGVLIRQYVHPLLSDIVNIVATESHIYILGKDSIRSFEYQK